MSKLFYAEIEYWKEKTRNRMENFIYSLFQIRKKYIFLKKTDQITDIQQITERLKKANKIDSMSNDNARRLPIRKKLAFIDRESSTRCGLKL